MMPPASQQRYKSTTRRRPANFNPVYCLHTNSDHEMMLDCWLSVFSKLFAQVTNA